VELLHNCLPGPSRDEAARVARDLENNHLAMLVALGQRLSNGGFLAVRFPGRPLKGDV
jgi:hypothetical protein